MKWRKECFAFNAARITRTQQVFVERVAGRLSQGITFQMPVQRRILSLRRPRPLRRIKICHHHYQQNGPHTKCIRRARPGAVVYHQQVCQRLPVRHLHRCQSNPIHTQWVMEEHLLQAILPLLRDKHLARFICRERCRQERVRRGSARQIWVHQASVHRGSARRIWACLEQALMEPKCIPARLHHRGHILNPE